MTDNLTKEQQITNYHTMRHIERVRNLLNFAIVELLQRQEQHDQSKLESPEVEIFTEWTPKLANVTYGSEEYKQFLKALEPALKHHYARNRHHPEFQKNGVRDMNLIDLVEMFCDWKAASERHNDGNIVKSIEHNGIRFNMSEDLISIFQNTASLFDRCK